MPPVTRRSLARTFEAVDQVVVDGLFNGVAIGLLALAEGLRHALRGQLQTAMWGGMAFLVAFGIWYILRVPDTLLGLLGVFRR